MKGKALSSGERKIVINTFNYFKTENPSLKRNALVEMTFIATAEHLLCLKRIVSEEDGKKSPEKSRPKRKKAFNRLDEFDLGVTRRMMHSFYTRGKAQHFQNCTRNLK